MLAQLAPTFTLGGKSFRVAAWASWKTKNGRTVFKGREYLVQSSDGGFLANDTVGQYLWEFTLTGGNVALVGRSKQWHQTSAQWEANQYLDNPAAWEAHENDRIREANIGGGLAHSIGGAIHSIGHVLGDVAEFGLQLNEAVLHPLTFDLAHGGLQLSNDALDVIPDDLEDAAQFVTAAGGILVAGGAALTAFGGIGAVTDTIGSVSGALSGAQEVLGAVTSFLPAGVTPILPNHPAAAAAPPAGVVTDAAMGFGVGLGTMLLVGVALYLIVKRS